MSRSAVRRRNPRTSHIVNCRSMRKRSVRCGKGNKKKNQKPVDIPVLEFPGKPHSVVLASDHMPLGLQVAKELALSDSNRRVAWISYGGMNRAKAKAKEIQRMGGTIQVYDRLPEDNITAESMAQRISQDLGPPIFFAHLRFLDLTAALENDHDVTALAVDFDKILPKAMEPFMERFGYGKNIGFAWIGMHGVGPFQLQPTGRIGSKDFKIQYFSDTSPQDQAFHKMLRTLETRGTDHKDLGKMLHWVFTQPLFGSVHGNLFYRTPDVNTRNRWIIYCLGSKRFLW